MKIINLSKKILKVTSIKPKEILGFLKNQYKKILIRDQIFLILITQEVLLLLDLTQKVAKKLMTVNIISGCRV